MSLRGKSEAYLQGFQIPNNLWSNNLNTIEQTTDFYTGVRDAATKMVIKLNEERTTNLLKQEKHETINN